jgi:hypothetical protein
MLKNFIQLVYWYNVHIIDLNIYCDVSYLHSITAAKFPQALLAQVLLSFFS